MATDCPSLIRGPSAASQIESHLAYVTEYGDTSFATALEAINSINALFGGSIRGVGMFDPERPADGVFDLPDFVKPEPPEDPELVFVPPNDPPNPPSFTAPNIQFGRAPTFSATAPSLNLPSRPGALTATPPDDPSPIQYPVYPDDPDIEFPPVPTLRAFNLPELIEPDLAGLLADIATLRADKPVAPEVALTEHFLTDLDNQYATTQGRLAEFIGQCPAFDLLCPNLTTLLSGESTGLPANVEQALRDRAFQAQDKQAIQEERQANTEFLARGFTLPNGVLINRLDVIRQQSADRKQALNRDIFIEAAKWEIENLRFALQQGIQYEAQYRDSWFRLYDLSRTIAAQIFEIDARIVQVHIEVFRVALESWRQEFEGIRLALEAELANLEIYRQRLEGLRLIQSLNEQDVEIYKARLSAVQTLVDVYKARVEAANSLLEGELAKIEVHKSQTQAYVARVGAYEAEWRGYGEAVKGELGRTDIYKTLVEAFGERVNAYRSENEARRAEGEFDLDTQRLQLETWKSRLQLFEARLQGEVARVDSSAKVFDSKTRLYGAEVDAEKAYTGQYTDEARLILQRYTADAQIAVEEARLEIQNTLGTLQATVTALDGVARTGSQLAASAMSSLNMGATISQGTTYGNSRSCSTNYSIDATPATG